MDFVLNNQTVENAHGFFLLNEGGDFTRFNANPVLLALHDQSKLIGKWLNFRVEGDQILAEPEFDEKDAEALKYKQKVDGGYLKGCSPGIRVLEAKEADGKVYVTKWELMEGSLVPVPSGRASLALYTAEGQMLTGDNIKSHLNLFINTKTETIMNLALIATQLGLKAEATEAEVSAAITAVITKNQTHATELAAKDQKIGELQGIIDAAKKDKVKSLIDQAVASKKIDETLRATYTKLAETDYEGAERALAALPGVNPVVQNLGTGAVAVPEAEKAWTFSDYVKNNKAENLKATNLERFKDLYKAQFGHEYKD